MPNYLGMGFPGQMGGQQRPRQQRQTDRQMRRNLRRDTRQERRGQRRMGQGMAGGGFNPNLSVSMIPQNPMDDVSLGGNPMPGADFGFERPNPLLGGGGWQLPGAPPPQGNGGLDMYRRPAGGGGGGGMVARPSTPGMAQTADMISPDQFRNTYGYDAPGGDPTGRPAYSQPMRGDYSLMGAMGNYDKQFLG